ncbi:MAG: response regulator transcription factor [Deltaproteobacteria bacterium]|nr:response regulator transcription factor [Deltaproteobacteria bacterium]
MNIRILLADDHVIVQQGLRSLLQKESDMEVVAEASDGRTAVRLAEEITPDVVLMDIGMNHLNGIDATRRITDRNPDVKVIALSMYADEPFVSGMLMAGASGYVLKHCAVEELIQAVRAVTTGQTFLSPSVAHVVTSQFVRSGPKARGFGPCSLTAREREVLQLLSEGRSSKQIAATLHLSIRTVEGHRYRIMDKLKIHNLPGLTKFAIRNGLTPVFE